MRSVRPGNSWRPSGPRGGRSSSRCPTRIPAAGSSVRCIKRFVREESSAQAVESLGTEGYFSVLALCAAMVGNSSSGLLEAPSFGLPVVNVGSRQRGRVRGTNVIDVGCGREEIGEGIRRATDPAFRKSLRGLANPYGDGKASRRIVDEARGGAALRPPPGEALSRPRRPGGAHMNPATTKPDLPRCVILGGGGHARVLIDSIRESGLAEIEGVLDPDSSLHGRKILDVPVLGGDDLLGGMAAGGVTHFVVGLGGVGDNGPRRRLFELGCSCRLNSPYGAPPLCHGLALGGHRARLPVVARYYRERVRRSREERHREQRRHRGARLCCRGPRPYRDRGQARQHRAGRDRRPHRCGGDGQAVHPDRRRRHRRRGGRRREGCRARRRGGGRARAADPVEEGERMSQNFEDTVVSESASLRTAMEVLDRGSLEIVLVVSPGWRAPGDADRRRYSKGDPFGSLPGGCGLRIHAPAFYGRRSLCKPHGSARPDAGAHLPADPHRRRGRAACGASPFAGDPRGLDTSQLGGCDGRWARRAVATHHRFDPQTDDQSGRPTDPGAHRASPRGIRHPPHLPFGQLHGGYDRATISRTGRNWVAISST